MNIKAMLFAALAVPIANALLIPLCAVAGSGEQDQDAEFQKKRIFKNLDTNHDNQLSIDEAENNTVVFDQFIAVDKDGNSVLDLSEFMAFEPVLGFEPPHIDDAHEIGASPMD